MAGVKASQGWQIISFPPIAQPPREIFVIPKERDRVIVKACELTPEQAAAACEALLRYLKKGLVL